MRHTLISYDIEISKKSTYLPSSKITETEIIWNNGNKDVIAGSKIMGIKAERIRNREAKSIKIILA